MKAAKPAKTPKKPAKLAPREAIVQAAMRCFVRRGIGSTRAVDIAREAKISPPLFAHHYPDIHGLYVDVINEVLKDLREPSIRAIAEGGEDPLRAMVNYIAANFTWASRNRDQYALWMCLYYMASFSKQFEVLNRQIRETGRERIALLIYRGIEKGVFRLADDLTVREAAWTIQSILTGGVSLGGTEGREHDNWPEALRLSRSACLRLLGVSFRDRSRR